MEYDSIMKKIMSALHENGVQYNPPILRMGGYVLKFPWHKGDIAIHFGTYGNELGLVETYMFPWDEGDVSVLTPEEAIQKVVMLYKGG